MTIPAMAANYNVSGAPGANFGSPTSIEETEVVGGPIMDTDNIDRSKNSQIIPPTFGSNSAYTPGTGELLTPNISGIPEPVPHPTGPTGTLPDVETGDSGGIYFPPDNDYSEAEIPYYGFTSVDDMYYADGSIGTLSIPKFGLSVKAYEGETNANMAKGIGHFTCTSAWDGNIAFSGHNRGVAAYFGKIHTLGSGDQISYTTVHGTRTYEVYRVEQISKTDVSCLDYYSDNVITLVTCVMNVPSLRWVVQAVEITG